MGEDREWLRINEGLWISASLVAGLKISKNLSPGDGNSPEHPVSVIRPSDLGQKLDIQEGDQIFLGSVSVTGRNQHSFRTRLGIQETFRSVLW